MEIRTIGIDLGKTVFHFVGVNARGEVVVRKKGSRTQLLRFTSNLPHCLIGMEACGGSHFLGRALREQGHDVRLMPAQYVKPYGSAPTATAANRGIEDRQVKLGCVMPGESAAVFGDALRRLAGAATDLYQDGPRYWYSTQPTVTKLADDLAEQLKRDPDKVAHELDKRVRDNLRKMGDFKRVHPIPATSADVPDDSDARLVVLSVDQAYSRESNSAAEIAAKAIFETRGTAPRLFRNTLVFLTADQSRVQELDEAVRKFLAWQSILSEVDKLDLSKSQVKQAETQKTAADGVVTARLPETYQWLLVPTQKNPQTPVTWDAVRLSGSDPLQSVRAESSKMMNRYWLALAHLDFAWNLTESRCGEAMLLRSSSWLRISLVTCTCRVCRVPQF